MKILADYFLITGGLWGSPSSPHSWAGNEDLEGDKAQRPGEVIGIVPSRMGVLTVEMAAVHAAMADCKPKYMAEGV